jgi:hypothetical protein
LAKRRGGSPHMDGWPAVLSKTAMTSNKNPSSSTQPYVECDKERKAKSKS